jgi:hypothetical protein
MELRRDSPMAVRIQSKLMIAIVFSESVAIYALVIILLLISHFRKCGRHAQDAAPPRVHGAHVRDRGMQRV